MPAAERPGLVASGVSDARVIVRVDLNVPLNGRTIADDARLRAALPTLRALGSRRNRILIVAHLGRPAEPQPDLSLAPVARALSRLLGRSVPLVPSVERWSRDAPGAETALLENIRFDPREPSASAAERRELAAELRAGADLVVSDAFSTFHRRHATIVELVQPGPSVAGSLVELELAALAPLRSAAAPLLVIVGGTRVEEKLGILDGLAASPATVLLGAQMAAGLTGLVARGGPKGAVARGILARGSTVLPADVVVGGEAGRLRVVPLRDVVPGMRVIDLGPQACTHVAELVRAARTVVWNGPPGLQHERAGRRGAETLAAACAESRAVTIVGGGTTSMPLRWLGLIDRVTHVSTGGTVLLQMLLGRPVPGLDAVLAGGRNDGAGQSPTATTSSTRATARRQPARARSARS